MANASHFSFITDSPITLNFGGDIDFETGFDLTPDLDVGSRSVLHGIITTQASAANLTFELQINNVVVDTFAGTTGFERFSFQEVVPANLLNVGLNRFRIRLTGGAGSLRFSDVVLSYGVNI